MEKKYPLFNGEELAKEILNRIGYYDVPIKEKNHLKLFFKEQNSQLLTIISNETN